MRGLPAPASPNGITGALTTSNPATNRLPPPPWAWCRTFESIESYRAAIRLVEAPLVSTSATGACSCVVALADLGSARIAGGRLGGSVFTAGFSAPDELSATVVLEATGGSLNSIPIQPRGIYVFPPRTYYRGWNAAGYRWLTVSMTREDATSLASEHRWQIPDLRGGAMLTSRCTTEDMRAIRTMIREVDLWRPRSRPEPLDPASASRHARIWGSILARAWTRGNTHGASSRRVSGEALLRRAFAFLEAHLMEPVSSADVCRAARAPERTVEHVFRTRLGISPLRYLAVLRLRAARKALLHAERPGGRTVAEIARGVGFRHMGRFAGAYRKMFGELPTETRPRPRVADPGREVAALDLLEEMVGGA